MGVTDVEIEDGVLAGDLNVVDIDTGLITVHFPGQGHDGGTDVHDFKVKSLTGICDDTRMATSEREEAVIRAHHLIQETHSECSFLLYTI